MRILYFHIVFNALTFVSPIFRLLEDMCACHSERCNEYIRENFAKIKDLLLKTVSKAPLPCRGVRTCKHPPFMYIP